jgi:hypothetical protein
VAREALPGLGWHGAWGSGANDVEVRRLGLGLSGKNLKGTGHYLWGFLHRIIAEKKF